MANLKALSSLAGGSGERWQAIASGTAEPVPEEIAAFLALSDERARWLTRVLASWREGYRAGREDGQREGYERACADAAVEWRKLAHPVADPEACRRELAEQGERAAVAWEKREQAEHEQAFVARAYATPEHLRTDVQQATVQSYPPPRRQRPSHLRVARPAADD